MIKSCVIGVALIALLGVACDRTKKAANEVSQPGAPAATTDHRLSAAEQEFLQKFAKANEAEIELARMAHDKADSRNVKEYAEKLEDDHGDALNDVKRIARDANLTLDLTPPAEKASLDAKLSSANGKSFDRMYLEMMVEHHKKDIAEVERARTTATGEVRDLIDKVLPVMREHLQKAEELLTEIGK